MVTMLMLDASAYSLFSSITLFVLFCILWIHLRKQNSHLPPGPFNFPFLGCIPFLETKAERTFSKWSNKYGPIIYARIGVNPTIVLNSHEAIEEAYLKQASHFGSRFHTFFTDFSSNGFGIMFVDDKRWRIQKRFGLRALAGLGLGGKSIEERVLEEAEILCEKIHLMNEQPFILEEILMKSVANVIISILVQKRCYDEKDDDISAMVQRMIQGFRDFGVAYMMLSVLPWCRFIPPVSGYFKIMQQRRRVGEALFDEVIKEHFERLDDNDPRDFTDLFLLEHKQNKPTFQKLEQLRVYILELFAAGTETSTSTIRWILLYLLKYPEIQEKVHKEIDEVVGRNGRVHLDLDLPYTKAVIQEGYRVGTVTPLGVPRGTTEDIQFKGFTIPKNTQVLPNIWHVHNDPKLWPEPKKFDPTRHLDENGRFVKSNKVIPFSIGPRSCLGENVARTEIFLFIVSILQKFEVCPNKENPVPCLEGISGIVCSAAHYPLIMKQR